MKSRSFTSGKLTIKVMIQEHKLGFEYKAMLYGGKKLLASIPHLAAPVYQTKMFAADSAIIMAGVARASINFAAFDPDYNKGDEVVSLAEEANGQFVIYYRNQKMVEI